MRDTEVDQDARGDGKGLGGVEKGEPQSGYILCEKKKIIFSKKVKIGALVLTENLLSPALTRWLPAI